MASKKPMPIKTAGRRGGTGKLMDRQDTTRRGDSTATRTHHLSVTLTDEVANAIEEASWERRTSKSRLIEEAIVAYLAEPSDGSARPEGPTHDKPRPRRISFCTTDEVAEMLEDAVYERRTNRSRLVEEAATAYLK